MYRSDKYPTDPQVSILPLTNDGDTIQLHCVQADPTFAALQANPRATFFISDFLAFSPHYCVDPENAARGTLHFRAVQYACEATLSTNPEDVAAALRRMLERYEPGAAYRPIVNNSFYGARLAQLATVKLRIVATDAKFKVGPAGPDKVKLHVAERLRERAEPGDMRAADVIEAVVSAHAGEPRTL